jgi:hypothetical protein
LKIAGPNKLNVECDFAMWRQASRYNRADPILILGECKTFDSFGADDVRRAKQLALQFPGSIFVFATLKSELSRQEVRRLASFAQWGRKSIGNEKWRTAVLVLTGRELFSDWGPPICWRDAGGKFEKFTESWRDLGKLTELCDATQQLYLDMEPYGAWLGKEWERLQSRWQKRQNNKQGRS